MRPGRMAGRKAPGFAAAARIAVRPRPAVLSPRIRLSPERPRTGEPGAACRAPDCRDDRDRNGIACRLPASIRNRRFAPPGRRQRSIFQALAPPGRGAGRRAATGSGDSRTYPDRGPDIALGSTAIRGKSVSTLAQGTRHGKRGTASIVAEDTVPAY